jgi:GNAT superfamily N-acetyltransferase
MPELARSGHVRTYSRQRSGHNGRRIRAMAGTSATGGRRAAPGPDFQHNASVDEVTIRAATDADAAAIETVLRATGQDDDWGGANPAYLRHLGEHGEVLVAERAGVVAGFGATERIGDVVMLCDLFVDPAVHSAGIGRALLTRLWADAPRRMTFSSLHASAMPLYASFGLDAWWPQLYLHGDLGRLPPAAGWEVTAATAAQAAAAEHKWTGTDRTADHQAWAAQPGAVPVLARLRGEIAAAGTVQVSGRERGPVHLALSPAADDSEAAAAVVAVLASLDELVPGLAGPGTAQAYLPAPHPAARVLLGAGWRAGVFDLFMASEPGLLDPRRAVPSPGQA